jgi:hypothetical protein
MAAKKGFIILAFMAATGGDESMGGPREVNNCFAK